MKCMICPFSDQVAIEIEIMTLHFKEMMNTQSRPNSTILIM